jgi:hypothetical protein
VANFPQTTENWQDKEKLAEQQALEQEELEYYLKKVILQNLHYHPLAQQE